MADLPSLSSKVSPEIRRAFEAVKRWLQSVEASAGSSTTTIIQSSGGGSSSVPSGLIDYTIPPALTGLTAVGGFNQIILEWNSPVSALVSYTEVWRSETDATGAAALVGTTTGTVYSDTPPDSSLTKTYYYWIRAVSPSSPPQYGPFNAVAGTRASTANEPDYVLEVLADSLDGLAPASTAPEIIFATDKFAIRSLSDPLSAAKYPFIVDSTYGVIMDTALIRNLTSTNITALSITGDSIAAATIGASKIKTDELVVGTNIAMGSNAYISWDNVTNPPTIPNSTYINSSGVYTGELYAEQITSGYINAGRIDLSVASGYSYLYTAPGVYTLTIPPQCTACKIKVWGGGGGGGMSSYTYSYGGSGGGGGGASVLTKMDMTPDATLTIVVGAAGGFRTDGGASYVSYGGSQIIVAYGGRHGNDEYTVSFAECSCASVNSTILAGGAGGGGSYLGSTGLYATVNCIASYDKDNNCLYTRTDMYDPYREGGSGAQIPGYASTYYGHGGRSRDNDYVAHGAVVIELYNPNGVIQRAEWDAMKAAVNAHGITWAYP